MGKITVKKQQKKSALMKSAFELFTTKGFSSTTIRDIANRAGVAKGTFYLYFSDKADIREAVIRSTASELLRDACSSMDEHMKSSDVSMDVADIFIYIIDYLIESVARDPFLTRFIAKHLSWGMFDTSARERGDVSARDGRPLEIEDFVLHKLDEYHVKIHDLKLLIFTLLELVSSTCHDVLLYNEPVSLDEYKPYLNNCIRLLVNSAII